MPLRLAKQNFYPYLLIDIYTFQVIITLLQKKEIEIEKLTE